LQLSISVASATRTNFHSPHNFAGSYQDILPAVLPFFHIYGMAVMLLAKLAQGVKFVTLPRFEPNSFFKLLDEHQVT
jgi:acyl-CoA synthetase (AMP-forming)/AMP-acid ligase II